jgi:hypothetical protein
MGKRDKKSQRRATLDPADRVRLRVKQLLSQLGLLAAFDAMPLDVRRRYLNAIGPAPSVVFDPSFPAKNARGESTDAMKKAILHAFATTSIGVGPVTITMADFFSPLALIANMARWASAEPVLPTDARLPEKVKAFGRAALPLMTSVMRDEVQAALLDRVMSAVTEHTIPHSRLDAQMYTLTMEARWERRGTVLTLRATGLRARPVFVAVEGHRRPVYPVLDINHWRGSTPVEWTRELIAPCFHKYLNLTDDKPVPVFVQSHALEQMNKRLDLPLYAPFAETWLVHALQEPVIAKQLPGRQVLVQFRVDAKRVGYLVVSRLPDMFLVRTFLFLTMKGTPEGRLLEEKLNVSRQEINHLKLDEMSRFTNTDLKEDKNLRRVLTACGCGHLFKLAEEQQRDETLRRMLPKPKAFAATLRDYVGLAVEPAANAVESNASAVACATQAIESEAQAIESEALAIVVEANAFESEANALESESQAFESEANALESEALAA